MIFDPIGAFVVGVLAVALAAPCLLAAATEPAHATRFPRVVIVIAAGWALVFMAAAIVVVVRMHHVGVFGLLLAAAEVLAAGAIWAARAGGFEFPGDDGGGGRGPDEAPKGPPSLHLPDEYWSRWEASLHEPRIGSRDSTSGSLRQLTIEQVVPKRTRRSPQR